MSSSTVSIAVLATLLFVTTTLGHSQMRCAKYNPQTGDCYAPIRNQEISFESEAFDISTSTTGLCQSPWTNPITASYANGAGCPDYAPCPSPMGTYTPGEVFYFQWLARNHAVGDQTPGNVSLYLSPAESVNQGADVSRDVFHQNKLCTAPFMSCNGQNGNMVNCSAPCQIPATTQPGVYTLWWLWVWPGHTSVYSTCADVYVVSNGGSTPSTPAQAPAAPSTTGAVAPAAPSTTGAVAPAAPSTTGVVASNPTPAPKPSAPTPVAPATTGVQAAPSSAPSTGSTSTGKCSSGSMKCLTSETYSMCGNSAWGVSQSCATGTTCSPSGNVIYCLRSTSPSSPATSTTTTSAPSTPATSTSTSSVSSGSCTLGYQKCVGQSNYQTCGNGANGPTWYAAQSCQAGLSCHPSATANNIYCY